MITSVYLKSFLADKYALYYLGHHLPKGYLFFSFIFLSLENYGVRKLEAVFAFLITTMAISFAWMFIDTNPNGKDLLIGKDLADEY
jgi:Mn2+/Fe2+ NRAMP family transporter